MKTLFKTITVVSLATLTAVGSTKFTKTLLPQQADNLAALNIYLPSEKNAALEFVQPVSFTENNVDKLSSADLSLQKESSIDKLVDLHKAIQFEPQSSLESEIDAASTLLLEEIIKFEPGEIDENEAILSSIITFTPTEINDQEILEPINIDQLIKFNPSIDDETLVEPAVSGAEVDQLIKFKTPGFNDAEIIEPQSSLDQLIKFSPTLLSDSEIIEPETKPASNCNIELLLNNF